MDKKKVPSNVCFIEKYDGKKPARIPDALYKFDEVHFQVKNVHMFRLLIAVSQNVKLIEPNLFEYDEFVIKKKDLLKYLGLDKTGRGYDIIKEIEQEVVTNAPHFKIVTINKKGERSFVNYFWFERFGFNADNNTFFYKLNESVKPYISALSRYNQVTPIIANRLTTDIQAWLYPWFKSGKNLRTLLEIDLSDLKEMLVGEKNRIYDETVYAGANNNFMTRILGISASKTRESYVKGGYTYVPMDVIDKKGSNYSRTIATINKETDIFVTVWAKRKNRKYVGLAFKVEENPNYTESEQEIGSMSNVAITATRKKKIAEIDMVGRNKKHIADETEALQGLFLGMQRDMDISSCISADKHDSDVFETLTFDEMKSKWITYVKDFPEMSNKYKNISKFATSLGFTFDETNNVYKKNN